MRFFRFLLAMLPMGSVATIAATKTKQPKGEPKGARKGDGSPCRLAKPRGGETKKCEKQKKKSKAKGSKLPLCVGVRGNGPRLFAHFPSLARVVEALGPVHGLAGGSSATVTTFLMESIQSNPFVLQCGENTCCSDIEQRARISFLLKSVEALPLDTIELSDALETILAEIVVQNIPIRIENGDTTAVDDLIDILEASDGVPDGAVSLINPDLIELLRTSPDPLFHAEDILEASNGDFSVDNDPLVFIRPYLLNFNALIEAVDVAASFYAGLAPIDESRITILLEECALSSLGLTWTSNVEMLSLMGGSTCGEKFIALFDDFVSKRSMEDFPGRLDDTIGERVQTVINTSVLQGNGVSVWEQAVIDYENVQLPVNFNINFEEDVRYGYFGDPASTRSVRRKLPRRFDDAKSELYMDLGTVTWRDALLRSPAEPTLSRGVRINDRELISIGGWTDPVPGQILSAMGCDQIVLINRPGGTGNFPLGITRELGISQERIDALYELTDPESSWSVALSLADATICADWDSPDTFDRAALAQTGYDAPFLSDDTCILSLDVGATDQVRIPGCTTMEPVPNNV